MGPDIARSLYGHRDDSVGRRNCKLAITKEGVITTNE
jgi:hypothetical protein